MDEDEFYLNLEQYIEESKKRIVDKERLIISENDEETQTLDKKKTNSDFYDYKGLVILTDNDSENEYENCKNIKEIVSINDDKELEKIRKVLEIQKGIKNRKKDEEANIAKKGPYTNRMRNKNNIVQNKKTSKKNKEDIKNFINLEKEIIITKTLMRKKKETIDNIYKYINKKEKIIKNLSKNMIKESEKYQELLVENFKKTEDLIQKFEEINARKKKKKEMVQLLNIEMSKLNVELEKKEDKIKELDKYKEFLNKLASSNKNDDNPSTDEIIIKTDEKEKNFSKNMEKYIKNSQLLIDHFNLLEEEHLQLIDDTQNAEYILEEYEKKLHDKKNKYEIKNKEMDNKITEINNYIKEYIDKISYYDNVTKNSKYNITFTNINNKIDYICTQLSYDVNTNEIMKKFQILENKIYSYITTLNKYTEENKHLVYEYQREREKERRKQMRFEINLDRKRDKQNHQNNKKSNNKNANGNLKDKKEKRENIYTLFEKDIFK
ncbi:conserved Plasmodium protein, unknown function [Plasmodium vinckei lentum]|uniref:DUF4200 domain-containing protein n=1 Tax=Plasmodium vinckei lentum TaxID=138297 RepID=A0A6V7RY37_PLAVN|nr:conserved Plasmodium protein, unknown function [Plasmodium vinckei lentum]